MDVIRNSLAGLAIVMLGVFALTRQMFDVWVCLACGVAGYFMMRDRGYAYTAIPVHLHRRFRHGFVFVNPASGIKKPADLRGKKVIGGSFIAAATMRSR